VVASLENAISELDLQDLPALQPPPENLPWWTEAMTLAHLETRMHAARLLDSPSEYKSNLFLYAKRISEEGLRTKGEELLKELCGPLYWSVVRVTGAVGFHPDN
jgi:protein HIRA/HIR1